ncbi:rhomboid family intramembrane serine protease [Chitinophaga horti]|uniref:Rhomboid family intramembrane serine protease n=1 Tax=Chitinophaga horti TaxID=2920382 RepID=A0ABY6J0J2_9BACT|nr:rhomboid family intramembrane serine protease [Chitinophaga horti]UYQ92941.1 rhomboid family intramembrane serine protease [Chitinophaga horti]
MAMHAVEREQTSRLSLGEEKNMVTNLLVVNLAIFILVQFTDIIYKMENMAPDAFPRDVLANIRVPAHLPTFITHPWTVLSAMFVHLRVIDIVSNMIWLWGFGTLLQQQAGHRRILPVYLFGGLTGIAFYLAAMNLLPPFMAIRPGAYMAGAHASVMALAVAAVIIAPKYRILPTLLGGIPFWIVFMIYFALSIGAHAADRADLTHYPYLLGGALFGWLYAARLKRGKDIGEGFNKAVHGISHMFHPSEQRVYNPDQIPGSIYAKKETTPFRRVGKVPEHRLDEILDKINQSGLDSLSAEEREILLRASDAEGGA